MECRFFDDWIRNIDNEMDKFSASLIYFLWMFIDITSDTKSNWANIFRKIWQIFKDNVCALNLALRFFIVYFFRFKFAMLNPQVVEEFMNWKNITLARWIIEKVKE